MAWTAPKTWAVGEIVTAAMMNIHIRDNELYLKTTQDTHIAGDAKAQHTAGVGTHTHASDGAEGGHLVDGVDVSAHKAGAAKAQHTGGLGTHTHQAAGAEGGKIDHGLALNGLLDDDHTQYLKEKGSGGLAAEVPTHDHSGAGEAGTVAHGDLTGVTSDQHHNEVHGAAQHTDITREIFISATSGHNTGVPAGYLYYGVVTLVDNVDDEVYITFKVPLDFISFTSAKLAWFSTPAAGNLYWRMASAYAASGEDYDNDTDAPAYGVTATGGNLIINEQEAANPLTLTNIAAGDYIGIEIHRDGDDVLDTLGADVYVLGILLTYTANQ